MPVIREALPSDVLAINSLRLAVHENVLENPGWLTEARTTDAIANTGRGWVVESEGTILGFSIANRNDNSIWALFVRPGHEKKGLGRALLAKAVEWLWQNGAKTITLCTEPDTRAEAFYRAQGWRKTGVKSNGEVLFALTRDDF